MNIKIKENWKKISPNCPPIAFLLKEKLVSNWIRLHNLPNSKRYPENSNEYTIIFERNRSVINYLSNKNDTFYIFGPHYGNDKFSNKEFKIFKKFTKVTFLFDIIEMNKLFSSDYDNSWSIYYGIFLKNKFEQLLKYTSDEILSNIILANFDSNFLYHPYDGGMDIILPSIDIKNKLKNKFIEWYPTKTNGF